MVLAKNDENKSRLDTVLHNLAETLRIVSVLINPFMHTTSEEIRKQLGLRNVEPKWDDARKFEMMSYERVNKGKALFPRLDIGKELDELDALSGADKNIPLQLKEEI